MEYGIYESGHASSVIVAVDGATVPAEMITDGTVDISAYMGKDSDGRITRNTWHSVVVTPDAITRIEADIFVKTFIRSVGGNTY